MLKASRVLILAASFASASLSVEQAVPRAQVRSSLNSVTAAVVQAVEDEIYDLGKEGDYFLVDNQGAGDTKPATISIYISNEISDGHGVALYKLMPYGEVYRYFTVRDDGLVVLNDDPHNGFKPTGGSMLTLYMSDEAVCDFTNNRSIKSSFVVDPKVSSIRLHEAIERQLKRTGFSYRQHREKPEKSK